MPLKINLDAYVDDFNWTQEQVAQVREIVAKIYIEQARQELIELATKQLNTSRFEYINSIQIVRENRFRYALQVGLGLPTMVEDGIPAFDMKPAMLASSKAKDSKKGGRYLTIPFVFRTTAANATSGLPGQILPRGIYDLIRSSPALSKTDKHILSKITDSKISKNYAPKPKLVEFNNQIENIIPKSSMYAGLQRKQDIQTGKSTYNTFRRVSTNSAPYSWIHPGIKAHNLMDQAMKNTTENLNNIVDKAVDEFLFNQI